MADAIVSFRRRHPNVTLEFRSAYSTRRCIELLHSGRVDLAWITLGQPLPGVQQRPVIDLPWMLVVHRDDPLAAQQSLDRCQHADDPILGAVSWPMTRSAAGPGAAGRIRAWSAWRRGS
jgi:DNA-binding transcriptional LysR family regulator